jgi:hypothetical protein
LKDTPNKEHLCKGHPCFLPATTAIVYSRKEGVKLLEAHFWRTIWPRYDDCILIVLVLFPSFGYGNQVNQNASRCCDLVTLLSVSNSFSLSFWIKFIALGHFCGMLTGWYVTCTDGVFSVPHMSVISVFFRGHSVVRPSLGTWELTAQQFV